MLTLLFPEGKDEDSCAAIEAAGSSIQLTRPNRPIASATQGSKCLQSAGEYEPVEEERDKRMSRRGKASARK